MPPLMRHADDAYFFAYAAANIRDAAYFDTLNNTRLAP